MAVPNRGTHSAARKKLERSRWFKKAQAWRTGCEGRIIVIQRRHGLRRCLYRGAEGIKRWVGLGVPADNLIHIGTALAAWPAHGAKDSARRLRQRARTGGGHSGLLAHHNQNPKPFAWTAGADSILTKIARFCVRTSDSGHQQSFVAGCQRPRSIFKLLRIHSGLLHFQFRTSGRSSPFLPMYCLCSISLSLSCCFR